MTLTEQIVTSLAAHNLSLEQERAVRACLQREIATLLGALPPSTHTDCGNLDTKTVASHREGIPLETLADVIFETTTSDDATAAAGSVLVTLSDMEDALAVGATRLTKALECVEMSRTPVAWQTTPKRCFQWVVHFRFNRRVFDTMVQSSAPAAATVEPETPPPEPNQFARVVVDQDAAGRSLRRKRDQLAQTLVKRATEADDDAIEAIVQVSREKASEAEATKSARGGRAGGAAASLAKQNDVKAFPKITVAGKTRAGGITKRKGPMKKAEPTKKADDDTVGAGSGGGFVSSMLSKFFEPSGAVSNDPYVAQYATKPGLFHPVKQRNK